MGKASFYLNIHGEAFTLFWGIPGLPLTNNIAGQMMKKAVLITKMHIPFAIKLELKLPTSLWA
ncbi:MULTISPECIES: hypothetical protein [unclassified Neochlamydia]|uniref:hypothetical protein n=1 Tax=unclassified Neochlamydia TaxID=2643326 RepID=UPI001BC8FD3F|nr:MULTISPECIES: hypothetical protein [unclassified Neochlamydia]MBS4169978.1 Uncharacterized protein [Neochlamydia sp. AcF95]